MDMMGWVIALGDLRTRKRGQNGYDGMGDCVGWFENNEKRPEWI